TVKASKRLSMGVEAFVPGPVVNLYRRFRSWLINCKLRTSNLEIFDDIYRRNLWGTSSNSKDLYSEPSNYDPAVSSYVSYLRQFIKERAIRSIVEVGCGNFSIARRYASDVDVYIGVDVSSVVIEHNIERFGSERI